MKRALFITLIAVASYFQERQPVPAPSFAEPSISPDGSEIAFGSGGDLWTAPTSGGEARLLVAHPAHESRPVYSPDGKNLAFVSTRSGNADIYLLNFASGDLKRLTYDDGADNLDGWSRDGVWVYFSSTSREIAGMSDLYRVRADGGTPMLVSADRFVSEFFASPSPDGIALAFNARGIASTQWWRRGHSHIDESEIWLMRDGKGPLYERVTEKGAKEIWPMWSADGKSIFYVSDRSGTENIWVKPVGGAARQITKFSDGRVLWPAISTDGRTIVFERNFRLWKLDSGNSQSAEIPITRKGIPTGPSVERMTMTNQFAELQLSPDGKKIAFVARGEIFAASAKDGGDAMRLTATTASENQIAWAPDSRRLVYVSNRNANPSLYIYDFGNRSEAQITQPAGGDAVPRFSPDGKLIAFIRDGSELRVLDVEGKKETLLAKGYLNRPPFAPERPFAWSSDGKWIAYLSASDKSFRNVYAVSVAGGEARQLSFLANVFGGSLAWSPDGTFLLFNTTQRTETGRIARIDLIPRTPKFREDQFMDLFREQPAPPPPPSRPASSTAPAEAEKPANEKKPRNVEIVWEGIRRRLSVLPVGVDADSVIVSPDGKSIMMTAGASGQQNLYLYSIDDLSREPAVARQLTSTPGFKSNVQFSPDGKEVFFLESGRISVVTVESRQVRPLVVTAEMDVDFAREKMAVFWQAWSYLRDYFYDPAFHGVDWKGVEVRYAPQVAGARTPDETRRLLSLMVGELNASHLGVSPPQSGPPGGAGGRLGLRFDRLEYERDGKLRITEIIELSPAALSRDMTVGDYLIAVDGTQISASTNLDELLAYKANRRVMLTVSSSGAGSGLSPRQLAVRPVTIGVEKGLLYRQWVNERREYVAKASNSRLGYVHMADMSAGALEQLHVDLDAENHSRDGVVIDVRNNNGGFVNVYAIDVFARRGYMNMTVRGQPTSPARTMLGQRALDAPTILVTNQHSLSDAEDFTEGYRALKLGKVVGEPTAGWIIYTSNVTLIDGSGLRIPFIKITDAKGAVMEMNPRPVDISVTRPIGEGLTGKDSQLDAAVRELLKQIGNGGVAVK